MMVAPDAVTDRWDIDARYYVRLLRAELERVEGELRRKTAELRQKDIELKRKDLELQMAHAESARVFKHLRQACTNGLGGAVSSPNGSAATESTATRQVAPSTRPQDRDVRLQPPAPEPAPPQVVAPTHTTTEGAAMKKKGKTTRNSTPYNAYMKDVLAGYKDEHPGVAHTDAFKAVAEKWKTMDENEKQAYQIQADAMNAKAATDGRKKRKQRMTPYNAYLKDVLAGYKSKHPGVTHTDAFKAVTEKWKTMDENEKQAYQIRADAKKSKRPKKKSAYDIFRKEFDHEGYKAKHPDASKGDRLRFIIAAWQETSDAEKQAYKDKAAAQNAADQDPAADDDEAAKAMQPGPSTSSPPSA